MYPYLKSHRIPIKRVANAYSNMDERICQYSSYWKDLITLYLIVITQNMLVFFKLKGFDNSLLDSHYTDMTIMVIESTNDSPLYR